MAGEVAMDRSPELEPGPEPESGEDVPNGGEFGPQDPPAGGTRVGDRDLRSQSNPTTNDSAAHAKSSPPIEDKLPLFKRALGKPKKFLKSKSVSALERYKDGSHAVGRTFWSQDTYVSRRGGRSGW